MRQLLRRPDRSLALIAAILCAGCQPVRAPPPTIFFDGLPVSGRLIDAQRAGFNDCYNSDAIHMRCRRHGMMIYNSGPYEAAVDLEGSHGQGGFNELVIWHEWDNYAVYRIADTFERAGWKSCYTGDDRFGDQIIYTHSGRLVRISMDMSYYMKRRIRFLPDWNRRESRCVPDQSVAPAAHGTPPPPVGTGG